MAFFGDPKHPASCGRTGCSIHRTHGMDPGFSRCSLCEPGKDKELGWVCPCPNDPRRIAMDDHKYHLCKTCSPCKICSPVLPVTSEDLQKSVSMADFNLDDLKLP